MKNCLLWILPLYFWSALTADSQELAADDHTLLLLHFNGNATGADGVSPAAETNVSYVTGVHGQAAYFGPNNVLEYLSNGRINSQVGTMEFWVKSDWAGGDSVDHAFFQFGSSGGMDFIKDRGNWFTGMFNLFGGAGYPMMGVNAGMWLQWMASTWQHIAVTWDSNCLKLYMNGSLIAETKISNPLPLVNATRFRIGSDQWSNSALAAIDELRISNIARTPEEISASYAAGMQLANLRIETPTLNFHPEWHVQAKLTMDDGATIRDFLPGIATWTSSDPAVAVMRTDGRIHSQNAGTATLTASYRGMTDSISINVAPPPLPIVFEPIDPFLATPANGSAVVIPVVILRFLPTADGVNLDVTKTPGFSALAPISLSALKLQLLEYDKRVKFSLEEASKFRGYKSPSAKPYIGYKVVAYIKQQRWQFRSAGF